MFAFISVGSKAKEHERERQNGRTFQCQIEIVATSIIQTYIMYCMAWPPKKLVFLVHYRKSTKKMLPKVIFCTYGISVKFSQTKEYL